MKSTASYRRPPPFFTSPRWRPPTLKVGDQTATVGSEALARTFDADDAMDGTLVVEKPL